MTLQFFTLSMTFLLLKCTFIIAVNEASIALFPSQEYIIQMARLSDVIYKFKHEKNCDNIYPHSKDPHISPNVSCHLYLHDHIQGTQAMIVTDPVHKYIVVIFAGTDDLRTMMADGDLLMKPFELLPNTSVHRGIENSLFEHHVDRVLLNKVTELKQRYRDYSFFTTGHSLGAGSAILLATTMILRNNTLFDTIISINFACPRIGNKAFVKALRTFEPQLQIWRVVMGYDVIARLPKYPFKHVGHTIQLGGREVKGKAKIYYHHVGNTTLGYAGVPRNWYSQAFAHFHEGLLEHRMRNYVDFIQSYPRVVFNLNHFESLPENIEKSSVNIDDNYKINLTVIQ